MGFLLEKIKGEKAGGLWVGLTQLLPDKNKKK